MSHLPTDYDQDILAEIDAGLVLHLDPDVLEKEGSTYKCKREHRVQGVHLFLCLGKAPNESFWTPLYSREGNGRVILNTAATRPVHLAAGHGGQRASFRRPTLDASGRDRLASPLTHLATRTSCVNTE